MRKDNDSVGFIGDENDSDFDNDIGNDLMYNGSG